MNIKSQKGIAIIPLVIVLGLSLVGGAITHFALRGEEPSQEITLGTSSNIFFTTSVLPRGTSTPDGSIGTTSESGDRRFKYLFADYATSSANDIFDLLSVGRTATATIDELGNVVVQDLNIQGTCTGCGGISGGFAGMMTAWDSASVLISTSTIVGDLFHATSTTASSTLPELFTNNITATGLSVLGDLTVESTGTSSIPNLLSTDIAATSLTLTGSLDVSSLGTTTFPQLSVSTALATVGLNVTGDLNVSVGTSTFQGATFTGINTTNGLHIDTGDLLLDQVLKVGGTGTSTFAGTLSVDLGGTGTSTFSGILASSNIFGQKSIVAGIASTTADSGTTTVALSCTGSNIQTGIIDKDSRVIFEDECMAGQILRFIIDAQSVTDAGSDLQVDWDGMADVNGEFGSTTLVLPTTGTSTPGYIWQGRLNYCAVSFFSSGTTSVKATYGLLHPCIPY